MSPLTEQLSIPVESLILWFNLWGIGVTLVEPVGSRIEPYQVLSSGPSI